MIMLNFAPRVS